MGITASELAQRYPYLYHMAELGSWPSIQRHGLLSTSALLDLFEANGPDREQLECRHRSESVALEHLLHGRATVRDQKPMRDSGLVKCLRDGLSPQDWYRLLNGKVFFWVDQDRLKRLLAARAYRGRAHTVLTIDTAMLLGRHEDDVFLSPINSGATIPNPQPRGMDTFLPISEYPFEYWEAKRRGREIVVELAVRYAVPAVEDLVMRVQNWQAGKPLHVLWTKD